MLDGDYWQGPIADFTAFHDMNYTADIAKMLFWAFSQDSDYERGIDSNVQ